MISFSIREIVPHVVAWILSVVCVFAVIRWIAAPFIGVN